MKVVQSRPNKGRHTENWAPASVVRHPPVAANGIAVGDVVPVFVKEFRSWRVMCTPDRLRKIGVVFCEMCSGAKRRCTCPAMTEQEAMAQGRSYAYDGKWAK